MTLTLKDTYKLYKETTSKPVGFKTYVELTSKFMLFLVSKVLSGSCVPLPGKLGTLEVRGRKQKPKMIDGKVVGLAPDWVKTKQLWNKNPEAKKEKKLVYHTNYETDGYRYKFFWSKKRVLVENKALYTLKMTRTNKRTLSQHIKDGVPYKTTN